MKRLRQALVDLDEWLHYRRAWRLSATPLERWPRVYWFRFVCWLRDHLARGVS